MSLCCCRKPENEDDRNFSDLPCDVEIPVKDRKQTDLNFFIILVVFFSFLVICVSVAGNQGDVRRFFYEFDDKGNLCGFKNEPIVDITESGLDKTEEKFLQITEVCGFNQTCRTIKNCVKTCKDGFAPSLTSRCIEKENKKILRKNIGPSYWELLYSDLTLCWREIIVLCFGSICLCGLILTVLRLFAKIFITVIVVIVSFAATGWIIFAWVMVIIKAVEMSKLEDRMQRKLKDEEMRTWGYIAILYSIFTGLFFYLLYKFRKKRELIAAIFEEGGKCIKDIPTLLLQPVLTNLVTAVFAAFTVFGIICFQTSGRGEIGVDGKVYFPNNAFFQITSWLLFFAFIWLSQFFLGCQNLVIAGAVSSWYFSRVKDEVSKPVWRSFCMIVKNHLGSSAFGSLLISIIKAFQLIMRLLEGSSRSGRNPLATLFYGLIHCILACLESFVRILNKTAYVMIVLFGQPFCASSRRAFACITSDASKVALIIAVATFLLTAIELMIAFSITFVGIAIFMNISGINLFWSTTIIVFLLSYLCAHSFFSVYEMTIDTLILCFCVDHQMNDGLENPYYMNKNLMIFLNEEDFNIISVVRPRKDEDQDAVFVSSV